MLNAILWIIWLLILLWLTIFAMLIYILSIIVGIKDNDRDFESEAIKILINLSFYIVLSIFIILTVIKLYFNF